MSHENRFLAMVMPANVLGEIMMLFVKERECVFAHLVQQGAERGCRPPQCSNRSSGRLYEHITGVLPWSLLPVM